MRRFSILWLCKFSVVSMVIEQILDIFLLEDFLIELLPFMTFLSFFLDENRVVCWFGNSRLLLFLKIGVTTCHFIKKRHQHRCFPVELDTFFKNTFFYRTILKLFQKLFFGNFVLLKDCNSSIILTKVTFRLRNQGLF